RSYMAGVRDGRLVGEACDDGNHFNMDGCSAGSVVNIGCTVESGWTCTGEPSVCVLDSGGSSSSSSVSSIPSSSSASSVALGCGNGIVEGEAENCDDGDTTGGDGCSAICRIESANGWVCTGSPSQCAQCTAAVSVEHPLYRGPAAILKPYLMTIKEGNDYYLFDSHSYAGGATYTHVINGVADAIRIDELMRNAYPETASLPIIEWMYFGGVDRNHGLAFSVFHLKADDGNGHASTQIAILSFDYRSGTARSLTLLPRYDYEYSPTWPATKKYLVHDTVSVNFNPVHGDLMMIQKRIEVGPPGHVVPIDTRLLMWRQDAADPAVLNELSSLPLSMDKPAIVIDEQNGHTYLRDIIYGSGVRIQRMDFTAGAYSLAETLLVPGPGNSVSPARVINGHLYVPFQGSDNHLQLAEVALNPLALERLISFDSTLQGTTDFAALPDWPDHFVFSVGYWGLYVANLAQSTFTKMLTPLQGQERPFHAASSFETMVVTTEGVLIPSAYRVDNALPERYDRTSLQRIVLDNVCRAP
ncbi:MAG: hypothetical protein V1926_04430, partial [Candidatus Peregrinibacteria bacterium]